MFSALNKQFFLKHLYFASVYNHCFVQVWIELLCRRIPQCKIDLGIGI